MKYKMTQHVLKVVLTSKLKLRISIGRVQRSAIFLFPGCVYFCLALPG